jgi:sodium transport system permease protein
MINLIFIGSFLQKKYGIEGILYTQILLILLPSLAIIYFMKLDMTILRLKKTSFKNLAGASGVWAIGFILIMFYSVFQNYIFPSWSEDLKILGDFLKNADYFQMLIFLSIAPAICEEILFRGIIFGTLEKKIGFLKSIFISSILFGLFHIYPAKIAVTAMLGMIFAYVVYKSGSIYTSMLMHFINNFFTLFIGKNTLSTEYMKINFIYIAIVYALLIYSGIIWLRKK